MAEYRDTNNVGGNTQYSAEMNRKMRHQFRKISPTQLTSTEGGVQSLASGGTGSNLSAPTVDKILFFDKSGNLVDWLSIGNGLVITGTSMAVKQSDLSSIDAAKLGGENANKYPLISEGTTAPSSTPSRIGLFYIDTVAEKVYMSTGTTSSANWTALN